MKVVESRFDEPILIVRAEDEDENHSVTVTLRVPFVPDEETSGRIDGDGWYLFWQDVGCYWLYEDREGNVLDGVSTEEVMKGFINAWRKLCYLHRELQYNGASNDDEKNNPCKYCEAFKECPLHGVYDKDDDDGKTKEI